LGAWDVRFWILDFGLGTDASDEDALDEDPPVPNPKSKIQNLKSEPSTSGIQQDEVLVLLSRLVSKSLVVAEAPTGAMRYRLLETIRQYAGEKLETEAAGEAERVGERHLAFYLKLAEEAEPALTGAEQGAWLARLDADYENLRQALDGSGKHPAGLRLAAALGRYWQIRGYFGEGRAQLMRALALGPSLSHPAAEIAGEQPAGTDTTRLAPDAPADTVHARAKALGWAGFLAANQGEYATARACCEGSLALWRRLGEKRGAAGALGCLAIVAKDQGERDTAGTLFAESLALAQEAGDTAGMAGALGYLGILAADRQDHAAAHAFYAESLALRRRLQDRWGIAASLNNLGLLALRQGDAGAARPLLAESLEIRRELGDRRCIAISLNTLGLAACAQGDTAAARTFCAESLALAWEIGDRRSVAYSLEAFARLAVGQADSPPHVLATRAARLGGAAQALRDAMGAPLTPADREAFAPVVAAARAALGDAAFTAGWEAGRGLPLEQAVREALHEVAASP
jgi:hypothetical protein